MGPQEGSDPVSPLLAKQVAEHVSPGDDVYVSICQGSGKENGTVNSAATAAPSAAPLAASSAPAAAATGEKLAKKLKVYVHYEAAADSKDPTATSVCTVEDTGKSVGNVIEEFVAGEGVRRVVEV